MKKQSIILFIIMLILSTAGCTTTGLVSTPESVSDADIDKLDTDNSGIINITLDPNYEGAVPRVITPFIPGPVAAIDPYQTPTRAGFSLSGWFYDKNCTIPLDEKNPVTSDVTLYAKWTSWDEGMMDVYNEYLKEITLANYITARPTAYSEETFKPYEMTAFMLRGTAFFRGTTPELLPQIEAAAALRSELEAIKDPEEDILYIWGENIAQADNAEDYDHSLAWDNADFKPFLVPFMLEDQSLVKGNIILVAGGAFMIRCNFFEGYEAAEYYNSIGYNVFILQRRVMPNPTVDAYLDLQRSIRYLRYYAQEIGIAAVDKMAAIGFSGGGATILGMVNNYYGYELPTKVYPQYVPDEVDSVNSDLQAMLLLYPVGYFDEKTRNPNIPKTFMAAGQSDSYLSDIGTIEIYKQLKQKGVNVDLHIFADSPHGFALGNGVPMLFGPMNATTNWPLLSKDFLEVELGYLPRMEPMQ